MNLTNNMKNGRVRKAGRMSDVSGQDIPVTACAGTRCSLIVYEVRK